MNLEGRILILSGEGDNGTFEEYTGKKTEQALKNRLAKERAGGDRWAKAYVYSHTNEGGDVYTELETGEQRHID